MTSLAKPISSLMGDSQATSSFLEKNEDRIGQLNLIMRDRGWFSASHMFLEMVIVAERDSAFAQQFQKWLDKKGSTLLLWSLTEKVQSGFATENAFLDARAGIDSANNILTHHM